MLERYASKRARTVLRGGGAGNSTSLPDWISPDFGSLGTVRGYQMGRENDQPLSESL
jgi:hypothetical protein